MNEIALSLIGAGVVNAAVLATLLAFHRSAVNAHKERADNWFEAWKLERAISGENDRQTTKVVGAVERAAERVVSTS